MVRKVCLAATMQFMSHGSASQLLWAIIITATHASIVAWYKPYKAGWLNDMAFFASAALTVTVLTGPRVCAHL